MLESQKMQLSFLVTDGNGQKLKTHRLARLSSSSAWLGLIIFLTSQVRNI
jgi:hypothetical protein